jgi:integrase
VGAFLGEWLTSKVDAGAIRATTAKSYRQHIDDYLTPHLGTVRIVDLRADHVRAMLRAVREDRRAHGLPPLTGATERRILATLRSACRSGLAEGLVTIDPTRRVEVRKDATGRVDPWSWDEFEAFEAWLHAQPDGSRAARLAPVVAVAARTGLRLGEVCGLRWSDVDLTAGRLVVAQQAQKIDRGDVVYTAPKSDASQDRPVPLVPDVVDVLRAHKAAQAVDRLAWGTAWAGTGLVFTREDGTGLIPASVSQAFRECVRASGLRTVRFHDLRHLAATTMLANGVPLTLVASVLGHSQVAVTHRFYSHVTGDDAAAYMAAAFGHSGATRKHAGQSS